MSSMEEGKEGSRETDYGIRVAIGVYVLGISKVNLKFTVKSREKGCNHEGSCTCGS